VNKAAVRVTKPGVHYEPDHLNYVGVWSRECPKLVPPKDPLQLAVIGMKFGRFTVVGVYYKKKEKTSSSKRLYVVLCLCGVYEIRTMKAILNPKNQKDCCHFCQHLVYMKRSALAKQGVFLNKEDM
jgi:uncharacterized membrane protein YuzA (DUF378 family)